MNDDTRAAIARALEREPGCVRSLDPLARAIEQSSAVDVALLTVAIQRKEKVTP